jgi:hypothetical protein
VKQSGTFSFGRIFYAGHMAPFCKPLAALAMFEPAISGSDMATGSQRADSSYETIGLAKSTFREGISTIQFSVAHANATYDLLTNAPAPPLNVFLIQSLMMRRNDWYEITSTR